MGGVRNFRHIAGAALVALVAVLVLFARGDSVTEATSFSPSYALSVADPTPEANSNVTITTVFPFGDAMVSGADNFTFLPPEWTVASDAAIPTGSITAISNALAKLGAFNAFCGVAPVPVAGLPLIEASTDTTDTVIFEDDGDSGVVGEVFEAPATDTYPVPNHVLAVRKGTIKYPAWIAAMFPPPIPHPRLRYWGYLDIAGNDIAINFIIWDKGALSSRGIGADKGYPMALFLNRVGDPNDPGNPGSALTDFCTDFTASITFKGVTSPNPFAPGSAFVAQLQNPRKGTYDFRDFFRSQRDTDNDGIENGLDTCPVAFNADASPRTPGASLPLPLLIAAGPPPVPSTQDPDGWIDLFIFTGGLVGIPGSDPTDISAPEGIDSACDPGPASPCGPSPFDDFFAQDCDLDGYKNRSDNCPLVPNGLVAGAIVPGVSQADTDGTVGSFAPDLGPIDDDIGDACDPFPSVPNGHYHMSTDPTGGVGPICITSPVDTCGPIDSTGNSPAVVPSIPASIAALLPAPAGGPITLPDDVFSRHSVTIGNHGVKLIRLQGASELNGAGSETYTVRVRNSSDSEADGFRVGLRVIADTADCPVPTISGPAGTVVTTGATSVTASFDQAAGSVPPLSNADVSFTVTYGTCTGAFTDTASDYRAVADACHRGDPSPRGLYGVGACGTAIDAARDNVAEDDAAKTKFVDDNAR